MSVTLPMEGAWVSARKEDWVFSHCRAVRSVLRTTTKSRGVEPRWMTRTIAWTIRNWPWWWLDRTWCCKKRRIQVNTELPVHSPLLRDHGLPVTWVSKKLCNYEFWHWLGHVDLGHWLSVDFLHLLVLSEHLNLLLTWLGWWPSLISVAVMKCFDQKPL